MVTSKTSLAVFAKPAIVGHSKTRLAKTLAAFLPDDIDPQMTAAMLAESFLKDTAGNLAPLPLRKFLFYSQLPEDPSFEPFADAGFEFLPQCHGDLGAKLQDCIDQLFQTYHSEHVIIIGSDTPHLPPETVMRTAQLLAELPSGTSQDSKDYLTDRLVLGPSVDGGYYLIGMNRAEHLLFEGITWSSSSVLEETIAQAAKLELKVDLLERMRDIDVAEDLRLVLSRADDGAAPSTRRVAQMIRFIDH